MKVRRRMAAALWAASVCASLAGPASGAVLPAIAANDDSWVRVAVVAASAKGMEGDQPLRYAYRDGERLQTMLSSVGQVEPANLFLLKAESREEFRAALVRIGERIGALKGNNRKVFLQFYYSGHGGAKRFHFSDGTLSFDEVKAALGGDRADARVYVLDVCFGASFFNAKGFRTAPPVQLQMEMDQAARGEVTISSSSMDEQAYEVKTLGGSIFTSHWIMALRGAGDRNRDGQVTLFEAYNYAYDRTSGYSAETLDRPQHPSFQMDLTGARDVTLARLLHSTTGILFKGCPAGLYNVVDLQRGIQIGELRIPEGEEFTLALEPGRYRVAYLPGKPGRGPSQSADLQLTTAAMATLPFAAFKNQPATAGLAKGSGYPGETPEAASGETVDRTESGVAPGGETLPLRRQGPGCWGRTGFAFWGGAAGFEDPALGRNLSRLPDVDGYFGAGGAFRKPGLRSDWGSDVSLDFAGGWALGIRFGFTEADYALETTGREPLNSLPDSARDGYPVRLPWKYGISDFRIGGFLARTFQVTRGRSLFAEAGVAAVTRTLESDRTLVRPLYETTTRTSAEYSGDGVRLEAGLGYRATLPGRLIGKGLVLGIRVSPYYLGMRGLRDDHGTDLGAHELGCAAAVTLALSGRAFPLPVTPDPLSDPPSRSAP